jgi:hypothetical protein
MGKAEGKDPFGAANPKGYLGAPAKCKFLRFETLAE